jgi:hypothetical protein
MPGAACLTGRHSGMVGYLILTLSGSLMRASHGISALLIIKIDRATRRLGA